MLVMIVYATDINCNSYLIFLNISYAVSYRIVWCGKVYGIVWYSIV
jgi:hypothetical protein